MKVAILGFGTVGSGVYKVITENKQEISRRVGEPVEISRVLDLRTFEGHPVQPLLVQDIETILADPEVNVVVECMGGLHPSYEYVKAALQHGKSVSTSNKELVAACGAELMQIAREHEVDFFFEASVGGGIPILRTIRDALAQEKITSIEGILNGTTNYILTRMEKEGLSYEEVLADAQRLGYAERNPEADVEGHDACRKLAILASMLCGQTVQSEKIPTQGITSITAEDLVRARKDGKVLRLIAKAVYQDGKIYAGVGPMLLSENEPLARVEGVYNAVSIQGNMVGDIFIEGQGAGREATASAVVADVIQALRNRKNKIYDTVCWEDPAAEVRALTDAPLEEKKC